MKEDIKEVLNYYKKDIEKQEQFLKNVYHNLSTLQQENQQLKANLEMYENGVYYSDENDKLEQQLDLYKSIIDEVREYIFNHELVGAPNEYVINGNILLEVLDKVNIKESE